MLSCKMFDEYRSMCRGQPTKGGPPAWGLGEGLKKPDRKNEQHVTKCYPGHWAGSCEHGNKPSGSIKFGEIRG
jgi:hypothetical protein